MPEKKVLVAYATRCGSTAEVAEAIGKELCKKGLSTDVQPVNQVKDITGYSSIVMGSAVRMGRLMPEAKRFVRHNKKVLVQKPVAWFVVCLTMKDDTPENRVKTEGFLKPLFEIKHPVSTGMFAGAFDMTKLGGIVGWMMRQDKSGKVKSEDCRNWEAIRSWAGDLAEKFSSRSV